MSLFPYHVVDLTHTLSDQSPCWNMGCGFRHTTTLDYTQCKTKPHFKVQSIQMHAGIGTHIDSPSHCHPNGLTVDQLPLSDLIAPLCVIDVSEKMAPEYKVSMDDFLTFEAKHGPIPEHSLTAFYTGWGQYWTHPHRYHNRYIFPSVCTSVADILIARNVVGLAIDTLSPDIPTSGFPVHDKLLGHGKYIVENVANLHHMPPVGAHVMTLPMRGLGLTEAPVRMIGLIKSHQSKND